MPTIQTKLHSTVSSSWSPLQMAASLTNRLWLALTLAVQQNAPKCEVNAGQEHLLANREAVVPAGVGRWVHEEQASVSELQLHGFDLSAALLSP